ncbi:MAG: NAD(P)-dependent alcohol dehydrogenase [Chloroflexota bacterium]
MNTMKAIVYNEYGTPDVLHMTEMAQPTPADNEILVHVRARSVNYGDLFARKGIPLREFNMPNILWLPTKLTFGWRKPANPILGSEFAGDVVALGTRVSEFKPGDKVFGYLAQNMGANAGYLTIAADGMVTHMPANLSYEEAAVVPYGALTALTLLRNLNIQPGQKVLINGASGGIGTAALQLAKYWGAEVTGVAGSQRLDYMRALGADHVIDYKREDFTQGDETYDLIFDILGKSTFKHAKRVLKPDGLYLRASFKMREVWQTLWTSTRGGKRAKVALSAEKPADLVQIRELVESGALTALVDRCFPMEAAAEAHRYAESGQKRGAIVIVTSG